MSYVTGKFKKISIEYITALIFVVIINLSIGKVPPILIPRTIPWLFAVEQTGIKSTLMENMPAWYISAMLISMLPLFYMLAKNKDFFTKVFAPLTGLALYGYMFNHDPPYFGNWDLVGLCTTGVIRAIQGLCFGVIAYLIYEKLCAMNDRSPLRAALTVLESIMYIAMIYIIFDTGSDYYTVYSMMLLMPIAVAITFSQKSYLSEIFKSRIFRKAGTLSLAVYLTHYSAVRIVQCLFSGKSYKESCLLYGLFMIPILFLYFIIVHFIGKLWSEKIIPIFFNDNMNNGSDT